jgi:Cu+-exporting ATPase
LNHPAVRIAQRQPKVATFTMTFVPLLREAQALQVSEMHEINIYLRGLTCSSCTTSVQNALGLIPGVVHVRVTLDNALVEYDEDLLTVKELIAAIEDCGFEASITPPVSTQTVRLSIKGMTCQSCVSSIHSVLKNISQVTKSEISLEREMGTIEYHTIDQQQIIDAIEDCGFDVTLYDDSKPVLDMRKVVGNVFGKRTPKTPNEVMELKMMKSGSDATILNSKMVQMEVHGMTCSACVKSIEDQLLSQKGIYNCSVALTLERAQVEYNPDIQSPESIRDLIDDMGFEAKIVHESDTNQVELRILGMTCASCSGKIERYFSTYDGVLKCTVNLLGQTGTFDVVKTKVGIRDLIEGIESLGFNAFVPDNNVNSQLESLQRTKEIQKWRHQFWTSVCFAVPVSFISMVLPVIAPRVFDYTLVVKGLTFGTLSQLVLTIPVQFGIGWTFYRQSYKAIKHGSYTMDVLVALGTSLAFFYSLLAMIVCIWRGGEPPAQVFFEASSTLITFVTMGRYLENSAKAKTSSALSKLISLAPSHALLLEFDETNKQFSAREIPTDYIKVGDLLKILPGERIPCDGTVEFGQSAVDESLVTGEPLPVEKQKFDKVITGTVNGSGAMHIRAERVGSDTTLSQIVKLVSGAQASKAPIQAVADQVAAIFVPSVVFLGLVTFVGWMIIIQCFHWIPASFPSDSSPLFVCLSMCISVIVVACPCALGIQNS